MNSKKIAELFDKMLLGEPHMDEFEKEIVKDEVKDLKSRDGEVIIE